MNVRVLLPSTLLALLAIGCSGHGSTQVPMTAGSPSAQGVSVHFQIAIPAATAAHARKPAYVSAATQSATVTVTPSGGSAGTPTIINCTPMPNPTSCSGTVIAPPGSETFTVNLYDATNGTGNLLSTGTVTQTIVAYQTNNVSVTFNGVVASLSITLNPSSVTVGTSATIALTANALDADGNIIIGPGGYSDANGNPLTVTLNDSDSSGATQLSVTTLTQPTSGITLSYNGAAIANPTISVSASGSGPAKAALTIAPGISVDASQVGAVISQDMIGGEAVGQTQDNTQPWLKNALASIPVKMVTYGDDYYHWQTNASCIGYSSPSASTIGQPPVSAPTNATLDAFEQNIAQPLNLDVLVHVPLGTNPTCTAAASASEAAAWVAHENTVMGYHIKYWQLGLYPFAPDNGDYANPPLTENGQEYSQISASFSAAMKAQDPSIEVGVAISPGFPDPPTESFDTTVLANATYDFIIVPMAPQDYGSNHDDNWLLNTAPTVMDNEIAHVKSELAAVGRSNVPIFLDDTSAEVGQGNQQPMSIVTALFAGQALGEELKNGTAGTAWPAFTGGPCNSPFTQSTSVYGWQNFASDNLFSLGLPSGACPGTPNIPEGTIYPAGRAYQLAAEFVKNGGGHILSASVAASLSSVRAYAATQGGGYALMLFNLAENNTVSTTVALSSALKSTFTASAQTYGKAEYDQTKNNVWVGASTNSSVPSGVGTSFSITLPPWSMTVVTLQ